MEFLLISFIALSQMLPIFCANEALGEGFPSCVEVVDIEPPPYSVVEKDGSKIGFEITFSKPVFKKDGNKLPVFLAPSTYVLNEGTESSRDRLYPTLLRPSTSGSRKWTANFTISSTHFHYNYIGSKLRSGFTVPRYMCTVHANMLLFALTEQFIW